MTLQTLQVWNFIYKKCYAHIYKNMYPIDFFSRFTRLQVVHWHYLFSFPVMELLAQKQLYVVCDTFLFSGNRKRLLHSLYRKSISLRIYLTWPLFITCTTATSWYVKQQQVLLQRWLMMIYGGPDMNVNVHVCSGFRDVRRTSQTSAAVLGKPSVSSRPHREADIVRQVCFVLQCRKQAHTDTLFTASRL